MNTDLLENGLSETGDEISNQHTAKKTAVQTWNHDELTEFNRELLQVVDEAAQSDIDADEALFEHLSARLEVTGEIDTADRAFYQNTVGSKTLRIDGSAGDPRDSDGVLSVIICDFYCADALVTINAAHAKRLFTHLSNFIRNARNIETIAALESKFVNLGIAHTIATTWGMITKIKLILITNAIFSSRTDSVFAGEIEGIPATYNIWDLSRFHRYEKSGQAREDLEVDFKNEFGGSVLALEVSSANDEFASYLTVINGTQLAAVYEKWGARLLESNVRSFLQARRKVNQGIRDTIKTHPAMFFSYNNGLSATASGITVEKTEKGLEIVSVQNLQIVNGGQTTASLHAAMRQAPESLTKVQVQMKLTVVPSNQAEDVIPRISQFANSQNKVSAADFFSNHPFHVRTEEYSRRIIAPATEEKTHETKWFYERAHGQYLVERAKCTDAERRRFDLVFPKAQFFSKTDLAKVEFSFDCKPDIVSKGAQKNFAEFSSQIGAVWAKNDAGFDEAWFRRIIAKIIIFRHLEKIVPRQDWYPGGYRANIVTYAIAKLVADAKEKSLLVDLDNVWKNQRVSQELELALLCAAKSAAAVLTKCADGIRNITEWAKKQACWDSLRTHEVLYSKATKHCFIEVKEFKALHKEDRREAKIVSGIEAQTAVISKEGHFWVRLRAWGKDNGAFSGKEDSILQACTTLPYRIPSEKQCIAALELLQRAYTSGYRDEAGIPKVKLTGWDRQH